MATLEAQNNTTRRVSADLGSLTRSTSLLVHSMDEMRQQIDAAKQDFGSAQLRMSIADARDAAKSLSSNLRDVASTISPASMEADFTVLRAFGAAITEMTAKVDGCARKLTSLAEQPDQEGHPQCEFARASNDGRPAHEPGSGAGNNSSVGARADRNPLDAMQQEHPMVESSTSATVEPNTYASPQDNNGVENHHNVLEIRNRA